MKKEQVALFGGSFNPPHIGHSMVIAYALSQHVDRVIVAPTYKHEFEKELIPFEHRYNMARLAFSWPNDDESNHPFSKVFVSDIEKVLKESRTLNTIKSLYEYYTPDCIQLRLLIGSDIVYEKDKWYRFDEIEKLAPPIVLGRQGHTHRGAITMPNISSTYCRAMFEYGEHDYLPGLRELIHPEVKKYIDEHRLYKRGRYED